MGLVHTCGLWDPLLARGTRTGKARRVSPFAHERKEFGLLCVGSQPFGSPFRMRSGIREDLFDADFTSRPVALTRQFESGLLACSPE